MSAVPIIVPSSFAAGTTVVFSRAFSARPSSSCSYALHLAGPSVLSVAGAVGDDGVAFVVTLTATQTAGLAPGTYRYAERVTAAGVVEQVGSGVVTVEPNLATATAGSAQTHEERTLAAIEAVLAGRITDDVQEYEIAGRAVTLIPFEELVKLRGRYAAVVWRQRNPGKMLPGFAVQFGSGR